MKRKRKKAYNPERGIRLYLFVNTEVNICFAHAAILGSVVQQIVRLYACMPCCLLRYIVPSSRGWGLQPWVGEPWLYRRGKVKYLSGNDLKGKPYFL